MLDAGRAVQFYEDGVPTNYDGRVLGTTGRIPKYVVKFFADGVVLTLDPRTHVMQLVRSPAQNDPESLPVNDLGTVVRTPRKRE